MPPHPSPSPAPTFREDKPATGRHRRPEIPQQPLPPRRTGVRAAILEPVIDESTAEARSARHRAGAYESYGASREAAARRARDSEAKHAPGRRRADANRGPSGAHRAPSSNRPVDTWLRAAKNRPQVLLGTLVVAGLLLTAVPIPQGGESTSVMTAAAEAAGVISKKEKKPKKNNDNSGNSNSNKPGQAATEPDAVEARPAPTRTGSSAKPAPPGATPTARQIENRPETIVVPAGDGPFNSLRTTGSRVVMLSFDDGPDPEQTPRVLALLAQYQVKAVFCVVGTQARRHPELLRQIVDAGHVLCNHTYSHDLKIGIKRPDQITADLDRTNTAIRAAVPNAPIPYFRAPGGNFTDRLVKTAYSGGMRSLYWEVDPRDWEHLENETSEQHVERIVAQVKKETTPGAIVLSHDFNQPDTTTAYERLLPWLVENFEIGVPGQQAPPSPRPTPSASTPAPDPTPAVTPSEPAVVTPSASATG